MFFFCRRPSRNPLLLVVHLCRNTTANQRDRLLRRVRRRLAPHNSTERICINPTLGIARRARRFFPLAVGSDQQPQRQQRPSSGLGTQAMHSLWPEGWNDNDSAGFCTATVFLIYQLKLRWCVSTTSEARLEFSNSSGRHGSTSLTIFLTSSPRKRPTLFLVGWRIRDRPSTSALRVRDQKQRYFFFFPHWRSLFRT